MSNPFAKAVDSLFTKLGKEGIYRRKPSGEELRVCVVPKLPDDFYRVESHQAIHGETATFHIRICELSAPKTGDTVIVNEQSYRVADKPTKDTHNLVWTLAISPLIHSNA